MSKIALVFCRCKYCGIVGDHYSTKCPLKNNNIENLIITENININNKIIKKNKTKNLVVIDSNLQNKINALRKYGDISNLKKYLVYEAWKCFCNDKDPLILQAKSLEYFTSEAFKQENISALDESFDTFLKVETELFGVGVKTFRIEQANQKISEHDKEAPHKDTSLTNLQLIQKIIDLHNNRIINTCNKYEIDPKNCFYFIIARDTEEWFFAIDYLNILDKNKINEQSIKRTNAGYSFSVGTEKFNYNRAKSVLLKNFSNLAFFDKIFVGEIRKIPYKDRIVGK